MIRAFTRRAVTLGRSVTSIGNKYLSDVTEEKSENSIISEKSLNRVQLLGRLGRDAELRGSDERSVVLLSVATNEVYTKHTGERISHTDWHRISVFLPYLRDNVAIHLKKGDRVYLGGKIRYDEYRDNDSILRRSATILADDIINLTKRYLDAEYKDTED